MKLYRFTGSKWILTNGYSADFVNPSNIILFETFAADRGKIILLKDHIHRLYKGASVFKKNIEYIEDIILKSIIKLINKYKNGYYRCRILYNINTKSIYLGIKKEKKVKIDDEGVECCITDIQSPYEKELNPFVKSLNYYVPFSMAKIAAGKSGCYEAIFKSKSGLFLEGSRTNFFIIKNNIIIYPETGVLEGITRNFIIKAAIKNHIEVKSGKIYIDDIKEAEYAFLTGSISGITGIKRIKDIRTFKKSLKIFREIKDIYEKEKHTEN